ncbi:MAG: hypothetical protein KGH58_03840 [Candidatus Micrarchaeota archaeon]|nr:hypothetical protein [Candidatus Micrarchaeota archaeon]
MERAYNYGRRRKTEEEAIRPPVGKVHNFVINDTSTIHYISFAPTTTVRLLGAGEHMLAPANLLFLISDGKMLYDGGRLNGGALVMGPGSMKVILQSPAFAIHTDADASGMSLDGKARGVDRGTMLEFMRKTGRHGKLMIESMRNEEERKWKGGNWGFELRDGKAVKDVISNRTDRVEFSMDNGAIDLRDMHSHRDTTDVYVNFRKSPVVVVEKGGRLSLLQPEAPSVFMVGPGVPHFYVPRDPASYVLQISSSRQIRFDKTVHDHRILSEDGVILRKIAEATGRATRFG